MDDSFTQIVNELGRCLYTRPGFTGSVKYKILDGICTYYRWPRYQALSNGPLEIPAEIDCFNAREHSFDLLYILYRISDDLLISEQ